MKNIIRSAKWAEKNGKVIKWPVVEGNRGEKWTPLEYENNETKAQLLARWRKKSLKTRYAKFIAFGMM